MQMIPDNGLLQLFAVTVKATGGVFLVVVLSGLLSGLLTLGALELFFRARIQRSALTGYAGHALPQGFLPASQLRNHPFLEFLYLRYGSSADELESYVAELQSLNCSGELIPALARIDPTTFYQLHYRQLCGQLASVIANEGLRAEIPHQRTPLSDFLAFIAESRVHTIAASSPVPTSEPAPSKPTDSETRYRLELALRQVDVIQARLGNEINKAVYRYTSTGWTLFYLTVLIISWANFTLPGGGLLATGLELVEKGLLVIIAFLAAMAMALGTSVVGVVAFTWLDRAFAAK